MKYKILYIVFIASFFCIYTGFNYSRTGSPQWKENILQTIFVGGGITLLNRLWDKKWMWEEPKEDD